MKTLIAITGSGLLLLSASLPAAIFNVSGYDPAGLKSAIDSANFNGEDDTIIIDYGSSLWFTPDNGVNGLPVIRPDGGHSLTIEGNGTSLVRASQAPAFRFFFVSSGAHLIISNLILMNGNAPTHGGAIYVDGTSAITTLNLVGCALQINSSDHGGAIWSDGSDGGLGGHGAVLTIVNCVISGNVASQRGGAISTGPGNIVMNITNSTLAGNHSNLDAGALEFDASNGVATGSMTGCTFSNNYGNANNTDDHYGGAINIDGEGGNADLTIANCTFHQNSAKYGGAVAINGSGGLATVRMSSCTFNVNSASGAGGGIYLSTTTNGTTILQLGNALFQSDNSAANIVTQGISGGVPVVLSQGYNLSSDSAGGDAGTAPGGYLNHAGDIRNTYPFLDSDGLKNNGGPTQTIAFWSNSPALDHGNRNTISSVGGDQRGEGSPFDDPTVTNASGGDGSDIGAYEATVRGVNGALSGTTFTLSFQSILGHRYEIQSRTSLSSGTWETVTTTTVPPPISGTGGIVTARVPNALGGAPAFYRAHQLP